MNIDQITTEMAEHICDELCRHPKELTKDELIDICAECKLGQFICDILKVNLFELCFFKFCHRYTVRFCCCC